MTKLHDIIVAMIEGEGPMPLDRYMALCLGHPQHGYYMTRDPFGVAGDFTTAPEISQVFGELIGVWLVNTWVALGAPKKFALVELGPGRGTLMADILRVAKTAPDFLNAVQVHLVETSSVLRALQGEKLGDVVWHDSIETLPALPSLIIANEFFDALPIRQFENRGGAWFERCVGVKDGKLKMGLVPSSARSGSDGVFEESSVAVAIAQDFGTRIAKQGGAALVIDYGHLKSAAGDTLQALRAHEFVSVLDTPGEADITAHVDFEALAKGFMAGGAELLPMLTQGGFLRAMGLDMRTEKLAAKLEGQARLDFMAASRRLADAAEMGNLFKVMAVAQKGHGTIYPFEVL